MKKTERIMVRFSIDEMREMRVVMEKEKFGSFAELIRNAVREYIRVATRDPERITVRFYGETLRRFRTLIETEGEDPEILIREAVRRFADERINEIDMERKKYREIEKQNTEIQSLESMQNKT